MNKNNKSLAKDIGILLSVWGPLLFILIGGFIWLDGGFDGTIMEKVLPAFTLGFAAAFVTVLIVGKLFRDYPIIMWISGIVLGIVTFILSMCEADTAVMIVLGICGVVACVLVVVKWIQDQE